MRTNPELLLQLIAGGVVGAIGGTLLSTRIPRRPLRFALWVWLLILGGQFLFNSYQVWASPRAHKSVVPAVRSQGALSGSPAGVDQGTTAKWLFHREKATLNTVRNAS